MRNMDEESMRQGIMRVCRLLGKIYLAALIGAVREIVRILQNARRTKIAQASPRPVLTITKEVSNDRWKRGVPSDNLISFEKMRREEK